MIRCSLGEDDLTKRVRLTKRTRLARAQRKNEEFRRQQRYVDRAEFWGEIKSDFITLQHNKCACRERRLEREPFGAVEHDIGHYRLKKDVKKWPTAEVIAELGLDYDFETGEEWDEGYYLLAYSIFNYATACKSCNSSLKGSFFPIAGPRGSQDEHPSKLIGELPLLIFPLGEGDDDPESLIRFWGIVPAPATNSGLDHRRGRVTIDFFRLETRDESRDGRAEAIRNAWLALHALEAARSEADLAEVQAALKTIQSERSAHTSCARCFVSLFQGDRETAAELAREAIAMLRSKDR